MKAEYINPFVSSIINVFKIMLDCDLCRGALALKTSSQPSHEISGIIGLSGKAKGTVVLSLDREAALQAAAHLLGERPADINAEVTDAIGELTNMIAGQAKAQLEHLAMSISLPTVITGTGHHIDFPSHATPITVPFTSAWGDVILEVGLCEEPGNESV